jgi:hypothetical protein
MHPPHSPEGSLPMRWRCVAVVGFVVLAALTLCVVAMKRGRAPVGSVYRGLATSEWEREIANWDVQVPSCGNGGIRLFVWRRPSPLAKICAYIGIPYPRDQATLPLLEGDPNALPVLMELFESPDPKTRRIAIEGVWRIGDRARIAAPLLAKALGDPDSDVSCEAAVALMKWDEARVQRWLRGEE